MHECTIPDGENPTTLMRGKSDCKYILGIDPSFSNSPSSDFFAMSLLEIDSETNEGTLVHGYAVAGGDLKDHINYMFYLYTNFNIELIVIDNAGYQFLDSCNESENFVNAGINLKFIDFESTKEGQDYQKQLRKFKRDLNKTDHKICFKQNFTSDFLRKANEHLQAAIDHRKIWFASRTTANGSAFDKQSNLKINLSLTDCKNVGELIEVQDSLIYATKKQCALVEVKSTAKGTQTFDLPQHLKRSTSANRARRDNYTALMLANWALKCYFDVRQKKDDFSTTFLPRMV